jgi:hypothetical protein
MTTIYEELQEDVLELLRELGFDATLVKTDRSTGAETTSVIRVVRTGRPKTDDGFGQVGDSTWLIQAAAEIEKGDVIRSSLGDEVIMDMSRIQPANTLIVWRATSRYT